jgi:nucleotide-binding universal stress UspA family protein
MKTILVPLDGSTLAEQVLPYVRLLAKLLGAKVRLLHVLTGTDCAAMISAGHVPPRTADEIPATYRERKQHAWQLLRDQAEIYLATHVAALSAAGIQAESDVRVGVPHESIAECADAVPESLIALATHGYGGLRRWAVGSTADKVIQAARAPVFLVRSQADATAGAPAFKRILVPLDGSELAATALSPAIKLACSAGAELVLLRVVERQPQYVSLLLMRRNQATVALDALVADIGSQVPMTPVVAADYADTAEAIVEEAARRQAELIVMATHGYGGVRRWMLGSVADKVLQAAQAPLLLVRPPTDATAGVPDARCATSTSFFGALHIRTERANDEQENERW